MRPRIPFTEEHKKELEEIENGINSINEYKKYLAVRLREKLDITAGEIGDIVGLSESTVKKIHSRYFKLGQVCFKVKKKGGRMRENLTLAEEKELLGQFESSSAKGGTATMTDIKLKYEAKAGKKVPRSTISRLLKRFGWRKVMPRPYHPKKNIEAQNGFKKTSDQSSKSTKKHWAKIP